MRLDCRNCGLRARPYDVTCRSCNGTVQDLASALAKKAEWNAAPKAVIEDLEKTFAQLEAQYIEYLMWLRKYRNIQVVISAVLFCIPLSMTAINLSWFCFAIDLLGGGAIGWQLNKVRGGRFHGMALFGGAAMASIVVKILTCPGGLEGFLQRANGLAGGVVVVALPSCGLLIAAVLGGFLGLKMEFDHDAFS